MNNCIFCNFRDKEVIVYEDEKCFAAVSLNPINKYHVMVIPKEHFENFVDLPDDLASHIFLIAKKISIAVRKTCHPVAIHHISDDDIQKKGYNLVNHYKLHIIPRFDNDGIKIEWNRQDLDLETRAMIATEITKCLDIR
jgi:histidine triad (HIT) family protein